MSREIDSSQLYGGSSYIPVKPGMKVLDVGCGTGSILHDLARKNSKLDLHGLDIERNLITKAQKRCGNLSNVTFSVSDASNIDYQDNLFDLTYSRFLLAFVASPQKIFKEMVRVTKRSGIVFCHCSYHRKIFIEPQKKLFDKVVSTWNRVLLNKGLNPFVGAQLPLLFCNEGLKDTSFEVASHYASRVVNNELLQGYLDFLRNSVLRSKEMLTTEGGLDLSIIDGAYGELRDDNIEFYMEVSAIAKGIK